MQEFSRMFELSASTHIIDVGGLPYNWTLIKEEPRVTLVNLDGESWETKGRFTKIIGDGRHLDFNDNSFDIAYSNSVIEHVGDSQDQIAFALEIRRVARQYYVQTPNRWFFVEPHFIAPFIHYLPYRVARRLIRTCTIWGWVTKPTQSQIDEMLKSIQLLTLQDMQNLFPDAEIMEERFMGMGKSIIAIRR
jgi:SAM-dependent methyltransferase